MVGKNTWWHASKKKNHHLDGSSRNLIIRSEHVRSISGVRSEHVNYPSGLLFVGTRVRL